MEWSSLIGPGAVVAFIGLIGSVYVARSGRTASLPEHMSRELDRLKRDRDSQQRRLRHVEAYLEILSDHVNLLEAHIWQQKPPPPPPRPTFKPLPSEEDE
ncbi:hypothetical protein BRM3_08850 [Brachybacterium huguangmaarense]|uniref:Uncharacterized protein n=1 Tax=Brachybacterium huguangmaarense TaxID=1652028 RepID=A0ABY6FY19_9MICO|nr:hypothetical protein [Brachybacterium huguangmaarense]UYG15752.1 hypothetical protein BRM3_08850 [Brachybacterium huguangmaarense]